MSSRLDGVIRSRGSTATVIYMYVMWLPPTPPSTLPLSSPPHPGLLHVTTLIRSLSIFPASFNENPAIMNLFSSFPFLIQRIMCVLHNDFFSFNSIGIIIQTLRALVFRSMKWE